MGIGISVALLGLVAPAAGSEAPPPAVTPGDEAELWDSSVIQAEQLTELLEFPPVPRELIEASSQIMEIYGGDERFSTVEVSKDRSRAMAYWHGILPERLALIAEKHGIEIIQTPYLPGELRELSGRLLADGPGGVDITSVAVRPDGTGLDVTITPPHSRALLNELNDGTLREAISRFAGVPVEIIGLEEVASATERQYDTYVLGGGRIGRFSLQEYTVHNRCTPGFAVHRHLPGGSTWYGSATAAHCGNAGSGWIIARGTWPNSLYDVQLWGTIDGAMAESRDVAVIVTPYNNPYVWVGNHLRDTYTPIQGAASPPVGAELCFSGSFSGMVCANAVTHTDVQYQLSGALPGVTITGNRSVNLGGVPAIGNGDSGGPGIMIVQLGGGELAVYASTLISAMVGGTPECVGVPGSDAENGRKCSPIAYTTNLLTATSIMNWDVSTLTNH